MEKAHKNNTKTFDELTYAEQAKSINAQIQNLKNQINAHKVIAEKKGKKPNNFVKPIEKMLASLKF